MTSQLANRIGIRVLGVPIPQGSKTASVIKGRAVLRDANAATLKPWRARVAAVAADATRYHDKLTGPVRVWLRFTFTRPPTHYGTGRNADRLLGTTLRDHPYPGHGCGDADKLTRAIFDALTDAGVWKDDTQAVDARISKFYAGEHEYALDQAGVDIVLEELT